LKLRLATFVQSWFWFGLLQEFLNEEFHLEDWTAPYNIQGDKTKTTTRISTCSLLTKLDHWVPAIQRKDDDDRAAELKAVNYLLQDSVRQES
jgi:hypothetical protein